VSLDLAKWKPRRSWLWALLAVPAVLQLLLLAVAFVRRYFYPYDLEWMEGGMLAHALQLSHGRSIYRAPSVEFIPYLYTPLYPAVVAGLGKLFGLSYQLGRAVSIASVVATLALMARAVTREAPPETSRAPVRVAAAASLALFAACFPWVECFYDLVRGDSLFFAIGLGGLVALRAWAPTPSTRGRGFLHGRVAAAAAILALSFFAKQTGVLLVAAGGAALLVMNWRAVPIYAAVAGTIGLGGSLVLSWATDGWYWVYAFKVHQNHDMHMPRFWESFGHILEHFPVMTGLVALGLVAVGVDAVRKRALPLGGAGFLYWAWMFACGVLIGAVGWSTQWAVFNAFIPAMALGAIAAGAAVVPVAAVLAGWVATPATTGVLLAALATQLLFARWDPRWSANVDDHARKVRIPQIWELDASLRAYAPLRRDVAAGDKLIARLRGVAGDIFYPSHPWYPVLAGKATTFTHRIGVKDVTFELPCQAGGNVVVGRGRPDAVIVALPCMRKGPELPAAARRIDGLAAAGTAHRFGAVVLDGGEQLGEYPGLAGAYGHGEKIPGDELPRVFSGKPTAPAMLFK
jgi:hypothetical protein